MHRSPVKTNKVPYRSSAQAQPSLVTPVVHSSSHGELQACSEDFHAVGDHVAMTPTLTDDSHLALSYSTDFLCSRGLVLQMLEDYLQCLYPLIPVVHRPSFWRDVTSIRDAEDLDFLGLEIAICAAVVGTMPSKFAAYQREHPGHPFENRKQLLYCCYNKLVELRGQDYFNEINYNKWATSYLMAIAFFQIGEHNRARMIDVESMQLGRLLHLHKISEYEGLNYIETQLRKKGFWLLFYGYVSVHSSIEDV